MDPLTHLPAMPDGPLMYAVLGAIIIASGLPLVSVVVPAEPFLFAAVLLIADDRTSMAVLLVVTVVSSLVGDVLSYWLGRRFGAQLLKVRGLRRSRSAVSKAARNVRRRGMAAALVIQRWIPPGRGFVPATIGAIGQPFGRFAGFSTVAATLWGVILVCAVHYGGTRLVLALPLVVTAILVGDIARRIRNRRNRDSAVSTPSETPAVQHG